MSSPSSGQDRKRDMLQMDAARATLAASDEQGNRTYRVVVTRHPVVVEGVTHIVEERSYPRPDMEERRRAFRRQLFPFVPQRRFFGTTAATVGREEEEHDEQNNFVHKRARVPASSKAILGLNEVSAVDAARAECAVCLQDFDAEDKLRAMPCSHAFHQHCIFDWLRRNGVCPLCRHALPTQEEEEEFSRPVSVPEL